MKLADLIVGESYVYSPYRDWKVSTSGMYRAVILEPGLWVEPKWGRNTQPRKAGKGEKGGALVALYIPDQERPMRTRAVVPTSQLRGPWAETHATVVAAKEAKMAAYVKTQEAAAGAQRMAQEIIATAARHGIEATLVRSPEWNMVEFDVYTLRRLVELLDRAERVLGEGTQ